MKNRLNNTKLLTSYYIIFSVSAILFFVMLAVTDGKSFSETIFRNSVGSDFFMDFFNSIRDASTRDVYKEGIIYPPLANIFFYVLSLMIDPELASTTFAHRRLLQSDYVCLFLYFVFVVLSLILFVSMIKNHMKKNNLERYSYSLPLLLVFSYPMIYCIQRGNIALLSLVFSMFFVFNRNSENKFIRELSFILLAVAAGIKLYPAAFGLLLITDRKFKESIRLLIYGLICFILPFFFYDGIESIRDLIFNLKNFSDYSLERLSPAFVCVDVLAMYSSMLFKSDYTSVYNFMFTVTYLAAFTVLIFAPKDWQKVWAITYMIMNYSSTGRTYILVLAIIPFIVFVVSEKIQKRDLVYFIGFLLILVVIPPVYYTKIEFLKEWISANIISGSGFDAENLRILASPNQMLSAFVVTGMMMFMFFDTIICIATGKTELIKRKK